MVGCGLFVQFAKICNCGYDGRMALNLKRRKFVNEYCVDLNATQAALRAGYSKDTAGSIGGGLARNPEIAAAIAERQADVAAAAGISAEAIMRKWWEIATADHNDLTQVRRINCRYCHGVTGMYQWTLAEYTEAVNTAVRNGAPAPDGIGGFDYDPNGSPRPDCQECGGDGIEVTHLADTRKLSGAARRLYAGTKKTAAGVQILTRDQDAAMVNLARCMGMFKDNLNLAGILEIKPLSDFYATNIAPMPEIILDDTGAQ